ncbi:MAG: hypothetical protein AAF235_07330 [Planctomycetota bacterium]
MVATAAADTKPSFDDLIEQHRSASRKTITTASSVSAVLVAGRVPVAAAMFVGGVAVWLMSGPGNADAGLKLMPHVQIEPHGLIASAALLAVASLRRTLLRGTPLRGTPLALLNSPLRSWSDAAEEPKKPVRRRRPAECPSPADRRAA